MAVRELAATADAYIGPVRLGSSLTHTVHCLLSYHEGIVQAMASNGDMVGSTVPGLSMTKETRSYVSQGTTYADIFRSIPATAPVSNTFAADSRSVFRLIE